ncbi:phage tail protein [Streptomyces sp. NPDC059010]|uniref:phage tail protein n=1 Tax=Streptomyces sp. NPDC059010 TaxID=3346695 RepID=UPI0036829662
MSVPAEAAKTPTKTRAVPHPAGHRIDLTWTNPPAMAFLDGAVQLGVRVVRRERTHPETPDDGTVVYDGPVTDHFQDLAAPPGRRHYYTVFAWDGGRHHAAAGSRASALCTADHGTGEILYDLLPAVHRREDRPPGTEELAALPPAVRDALRDLPPALRGTGPLRRFLAAAAAPLDLMRSTAEALPDLYDVERAPEEYLPLLGAFLGWHTDLTLPVHLRRGEIRAAPALYRTVGTAPSLRAIVTRYTGRRARIAEYAQSIALSNTAPGGMLYALRETGDGWRAADDAAPVLGFGPGNDRAAGGAGAAAVLVSAHPGPYRLGPGMEWTVSADGRAPRTVRLRPGDAADLDAVSATELARVLDRDIPGLLARSLPDRRLELRSQAVGAGSALGVESATASLVTLEGAPTGRPAVADTGSGTALVCYATNQSADGTPRLRGKVFRAGRWGESFPVGPPGARTPCGEPAVAALPPAAPDGPARLLLVWVERPGTDAARLRHAMGTLHEPAPATLLGDRSAPLPVPHDSVLVLRDGLGRARGVPFARSDFADPDAPSLSDVVRVLNLRLGTVAVASAATGQRLRLDSTATGSEARLRVDVALSGPAAAALGFHTGNCEAAGTDGDAPAWAAAADIAAVPAGPLADPVAAPDGAGALVCYARHDGRAWQIRAVRFDGAAWSGDQALTGGVRSSREPTLVRATDGHLHVVWAAEGTPGNGWSLRRRTRDTAGTWSPETAFGSTPPPGTTGDREPALALAADGTPRAYFRSDREGGADLWVTTAAGPPARITGGPSADRRPVALPSAAGTSWLLYRSDRGVDLARTGRASATSAGTLRRHAGTTSVDLGDRARLQTRRAWDDLLAYTPHRPEGEAPGAPLRDDELYTRGTIGLHLVDPVPDALDDRRMERLRTVATRFVPANTRVVVVHAPPPDVDEAYPGGAGPEDRHRDRHPDIDRAPAAGDASAVTLPGWTTLHSAVPAQPPPPDPAAGGTSADPARPAATVRFRSHGPPPR